MLQIFSIPFLNRWQSQMKIVKNDIIKFIQREKIFWELKWDEWTVKIGIAKARELKSVDDLDNL